MEDKDWLPVEQYLKLVQQHLWKNQPDKEQEWLSKADFWLGTDSSMGEMIDALRGGLPKSAQNSKIPAALTALDQVRKAALDSLTSWQPTPVEPLQPLRDCPVFQLQDKVKLPVGTELLFNNGKWNVEMASGRYTYELVKLYAEEVSGIITYQLVLENKYGSAYRLIVRLEGKLILEETRETREQSVLSKTRTKTEFAVVTDRYGTFKSTGNEQLDSLIQPLVEEVLAKLVPYKLDWYIRFEEAHQFQAYQFHRESWNGR